MVGKNQRLTCRQTHAETPSSILFFDSVSLSEAQQICAENGEALLDVLDLDRSVVYLYKVWI